MKKKGLSKIISTLCAISTMTLCFSGIKVLALESSVGIDEGKTYIIHSEDEKVALYNSGGVNEGWIKQDKYVDFSKKFNWEFEKNGDEFYIKDTTNNSYLTGESKVTERSKYLDYVVTGLKDDVTKKGSYELIEVDGGYLIKSSENDKYLTYGIDRYYVTYTNDVTKAGVWEIEETPEANDVDPSKNYIMYKADDNTALYDDGGNEYGWIRKTEYNSSNKNFMWKFSANEDGSFYIQNVGRGYYLIAEGETLEKIDYLVSDKTLNASEKGLFVFEKTTNGYYLKSKVNGEYLTYGENGTYVSFTSDKSEALVLRLEEKIEASYLTPFNSKTLWKTESTAKVYRIPAITTANDGDLIAISDLRYNGSGDLGNHKIDLLVRTSNDNGKNWSEQRNLTEGLSTATSGYGDAAIVADRESDKVLILAAAGSKAFWHNDKNIISDRDNPIQVVKLTSDDGGDSFTEPEEITKQIYNLNENWTRLFVTSGRIMQSRYIKVGDYYRIYAALLVGSGKDTVKLGNVVVYSDDFGKTWSVLGDSKGIPVPNGDEAKLEELPNGNVVITSRTETGRLVNIFTYNKGDNKFASGSWEKEPQKVTLGKGTYATNGEILVVYARDIETNEYKYLALQSLPALDDGKGIRKGVSIFYKELDPKETTVSEFVKGWSTEPYVVQEQYSGYSTMTLQKDGKIGFFFEDRYVNWSYDQQFVSLDLEAITLGKYEIAFKGIGSQKSPYLIENQDQFEALRKVYGREDGVKFLYSIKN